MTLVLFDAYGTLFNEGKEAIAPIASIIAHTYGISADTIAQEWKSRYVALETTFPQRFDTILGANRKSLRATFDLFGLPVTEVNGFVDIIAQRWSKPPMFPDVQRHIGMIRETFRFGIISNGDDSTLRAALTHTGLAPCYCLTSERARIYKPDPMIFIQACTELETTPEHAVYVGNSPVDIEGAKRAGLRMILLNRHRITPVANGYTPDAVIDTLDQLLPLL